MIKRLLARWKLWLALVVLIPLLLLGIAQWLLSRWIQPAALVDRLEATYNCRAEVTGGSISLWSLPATLQLQGVKLAARDADADAAKPLAQRQALEGKGILLAVDQADLKINIWSLLKRDLNIRELLVQRVNLYSETPESGASELSALFSKPLIVAGKPNPDLVKPPDEKGPTAPEPDRQFRAKDLPLAPEIASARIEHVRLDFKNMKSRQLLRFEDANLGLKNVLIDGGSLAHKNHAELALDGRFQIFAKRMVQQVDLGIQLDSSASPFDPKTGHLAGIPFTVKIAQGSTIQDVPALQRIYLKMQKWEKYGLKVAPLPDRATIQKEAKVDLKYDGGSLTTKSDFTIVLDNYELAMLSESKFDLNADTCDLNLKITGNQEVSKQALDGLTEFIRSKADKIGLGGVAVEKIMTLLRKENLILPDGRLSIPMRLTGPTGKPEVEDILTPLLEKALLSALIPGL